MGAGLATSAKYGTAAPGDCQEEPSRSSLELMRWYQTQTSDKLPKLPTTAFTRESFYEDRLKMAGAQYLIDSNILIRWVQPIDPDFGIVESALETLARQGAILSYTSQNLGEF